MVGVLKGVKEAVNLTVYSTKEGKEEIGKKQMREECVDAGEEHPHVIWRSAMQFGRSILSAHDGHELKSWLPMQGGMAGDSQVNEDKKNHRL